MKRFFLLLISLGILSGQGAEKKMSIEDIINLAYINSNEYEIYRIQKEMNERYYKSSMHNYSYSLSLSLQPQYSHSISPITQPNGSIVNHNITTHSIAPTISFATPVGFTGGTISFSSNISYYSSRNANFHSNSYSTNLFHFNYSQPIQFYNSTKWGKRSVKANFLLNEYESVNTFIKLKLKLCDYYFNVLKDQSLIQNLDQQLSSLDTLVTLYRDLYQQGRIIKVELDDLLYTQMEAQEKKQLYQARLKYSIKELSKCINNTIDINPLDLQIPPNLNYIDPQIAFMTLKKKQKEHESIKRIPLKKSILETKHNRGIQMSLNTGIGVNSSSERFADILQKKSPNMNFSVSVRIPISDLKEKENLYQIAKLQWQQHQLSTETQETDEENDLEQSVNYYNYLINNINFLEQKKKHLEEELEIKMQLLKTGKIIFDEYNRSYQKILESTCDIISSYNNLYNSLYSIELLTFYDFINDYDYSEMIRK